ncbi:713_t:CDS:2 [Entrophospora sp. SA101]|nr:713_t:CDS:2 [Entrophospora sp. SA101]
MKYEVMHAAEERQKLGFALYSFFEGSDLSGGRNAVSTKVAEICHQAEALGNTQDFVDFFYLRITKHVFTRNGTFEICELVDPGHHLPTAIGVL